MFSLPGNSQWEMGMSQTDSTKDRRAAEWNALDWNAPKSMNWEIEWLGGIILQSDCWVETSDCRVESSDCRIMRSCALPWLLLLLCNQLSQVQAGGKASPTKNKKFVKTQQDLLEKDILGDFKKIKEKFNVGVDKINEAMTNLKKFTDDSIKEAKDHIQKDMDANDAILDKNLRNLENHTHERFDNFTATMLENLERLSNHTALERAAIIEWAHTRNHRHEDILKTHVALCAFDHGHQDNTQGQDTVVNYNSGTGGFMDGKKNWQVFNETCNHDACANKVLNRDTGVFKPPKDAPGLYMFTFSVTMDTWEATRGLEPAEYQFRKNQEKLVGTSFYCDIGSSRNRDKVQGSKTIFLKLGEDDEVDVVKLRDTAIADSRMSFCGALIHLDKVVSLYPI